MAIPHLSIVIPAHNEEHRLPATLETIDAFLQTQTYPAEVLVVENGSSDDTLQIARQYAQRFPYLKVIHEDGRGKGLAVRIGMLAASGAYRFICDADLSMPISEVNHFIPPLLPDMDIAIASREAPGAVRYDEPSLRHFTGRAFNTVVRWMGLHGLQDTQCGFKCFRAEIAEYLFKRQTIDGWTFDVEVLFIALKRGYRVVEIPVPWYYNAESKVNVLRDSYQVVRDLIKIRLNYLRGLYDAPISSR